LGRSTPAPRKHVITTNYSCRSYPCKFNDIGDVQSEDPVYLGPSRFGRDADFAAEVIRVTKTVGIDHVAIRADMDGNHWPVLVDSGKEMLVNCSPWRHRHGII
jgi:hypothetical protein